MARHVTEARLQDRAARARLRPREEPYWRAISEGRHVGYFKGIRGGKWVARFWEAAQNKYVKDRLGNSDDTVEADGIQILNWKQAIDKAMAWFTAQETNEPVAEAKPDQIRSSPRVRDAVTSYIAKRDTRHQSRTETQGKSDAHRLEGHVLNDANLANTDLVDLTEVALQDWQERLAILKASGRQRIINDFKAALNAAYMQHRRILPTDFPVTVKHGLKCTAIEDGETQSEARENQILTDEQVRKLIEAAASIAEDGDLARMVIVLAATGARFSQVRRMFVRDVQIDQSRLLVPPSRKGRGKASVYLRIPVGEDVLMALAPVVSGRSGNEPLFERWRHVQTAPMTWERDKRGPWNSASELTRPWKKIIATAGISGIVPYALRHSSIVRNIRAGLPIRLVAALHDTSVAMIERHYSRWITEGLDELAAKAIVPLVNIEGSNRS